MPVEDMIPEMLRRIQTSLDLLRDDNREIKAHLGNLEENTASGFANVGRVLAEHSVRMDRMNQRLERIEKRLDLVEA
jgi:uncharacterized protein Yka (UPF0111/DUF47 family)